MEFDRVLKDEAEIYINTDWRSYPFLYPILQKYFKVRNLIVWDFGYFKRGTFYRFQHEFILYATKGEHKRRFAGNENDICKIKPVNPNKRLHAVQKPIELIEKMLKNSSAEGDLVLDYFIGSGTTAEACIKHNRQFIGFEIDEKCFDIANERIMAALEEKNRVLFS